MSFFKFAVSTLGLDRWQFGLDSVSGICAIMLKNTHFIVAFLLAKTCKKELSDAHIPQLVVKTQNVAVFAELVVPCGSWLINRYCLAKYMYTS